MKKILFPIIGLVVVLGGGLGSWLYFSNATEVSDETLSEAGDAVGEAGTEGESVADAGEPIYLSMQPPFIVNFEVENTLRFLQVSMDVMARDEKTIAEVERHMPRIRNNLLMLLSNQSYETLSTREAKEKLRANALAEVREVLQEVSGDPGVEGLYFTGFVMQ